MTPLSNILSHRSDTHSFSETLERVEQEAREAVGQMTERAPAHIPAPAPAIELAQIKQALLDMRQQIDIIVSALDDSPSQKEPVYTLPAPEPRSEVYTPPTPPQQNIPHYTPRPYSPPRAPSAWSTQSPSPMSKVVEGTFTGQQMIGADGQAYDVPPNYASKSKMVEGDVLKLTITSEGKHYYKQIAPRERKRLVGELAQDPQGNWVVIAERTPYRILTASVTFHRARQGDQVVILVPEGLQASWGAVDTCLK